MELLLVVSGLIAPALFVLAGRLAAWCPLPGEGSPEEARARTGRRRVEVRGIPIEIETGLQTRIHLRLDPQVLPEICPEQARGAEERLRESGARIDASGERLSATWLVRREPEPGALEDLVAVARRYLPGEDRLELEVDPEPLRALGLELEGARALDDLAFLSGRLPFRIRQGLPVCEILDRRLVVRWRGTAHQRAAVARRAEGLRESLSTNADPWDRIEALLSSTLEDRQRLLELAERGGGPLRDRVLEALKVDPDPELAWRVACTHGRLEDWLSLFLREGTPIRLRSLILARIAREPEALRLRTLVQLAGHPDLDVEACVRLLGASPHEGAEEAWMTLAGSAEDPALLWALVTLLGRKGSRRCLPVLAGLRQRVGLLQFQLRDQIAAAMDDVRTRAGVVPGALSLAALSPEAGGLSVCAPEGGLTEGEPG